MPVKAKSRKVRKLSRHQLLRLLRETLPGIAERKDELVERQDLVGLNDMVEGLLEIVKLQTK